MAITLEDLAARVEELAGEKARMEQELIALRAALADRSHEVAAMSGTHAAPSQGQEDIAVRVQPSGAVRRMRPRPITRLGLIAAAAAGAYAVMPTGARAETSISSQAPITSPNGLFSLDVTNIGIFLTGPGGRVEVTLGQVIVQGTAVTKIQGPAVQVSSSGPLNLQGGTLNLNGGGRPVARLGDTVTTPGGVGTITSGAPAVFA